MDLTQAETRRGLESFVARVASASSAHIISMRRLGGGAVSENWALDVAIQGSRIAEYLTSLG